jgi:hypothetical protein
VRSLPEMMGGQIALPVVHLGLIGGAGRNPVYMINSESIIFNEKSYHHVFRSEKYEGCHEHRNKERT